MAYLRRPTPPGALPEDIRSTIQRIQVGLQSETPTNIGRHQNQWQRPITEYGGEDPQWVVNIKNSPHIGDIDFGRKEWARSRETVDAVMDLLLIELRAETEKYEGLRIDSYIRQGSSRDGLKVIAPDEFDTILEFHIEGLENCVTRRSILKNGTRLVPGFCFIAIEGKTMEQLATRHPALIREQVFSQTADGTIYISSRSLYQRVFVSMVDKACNTITEKLASYNQSRKGNISNFSINRKSNPPAINITINLNPDAHQMFMREGRPKNTDNLVNEIDIDIVPGLLLYIDSTTCYEQTRLNCPIHAVCKWAEDDRYMSLDFVDQSLVWDVKTAGYEKHILDVARESGNRRKLYILTALRIIKTYFSRTKKIAKSAGHPPPQLVTVLKSYHLKQITFYLLFYLCHKYPHFQVNGAQKAVLYFIEILKASLEKGHLPHFFYSNTKVHVMLPGFPSGSGSQSRYDLYRRMPNEALKQANQSLQNHLMTNFGFVDGPGEHEMETVKNEFKSEIGGPADFF